MSRTLGTVFLVLLTTTFGCAIEPKGEAIRVALDRGDYKNLDQNTKFTYSLPNTHKGIYSAVKQFNIVFDEGLYKGKNGSAILGKHRETKNWQVVSLFVLSEGQWKKIPEILKIEPLMGYNNSSQNIDNNHIIGMVVHTEDNLGHGPDVGSAEWQRSVNYILDMTTSGEIVKTFLQ